MNYGLCPGEGNGHTTPVLLPGKSHGWRSLVGCSPWGREESNTTERLPFHFSLSCIGGGNGNPLQCSCLENPRDGRAWWAAVYGVAQSRTRLKRLSTRTLIYIVVVVRSLSCVRLFATPWTTTHHVTLSFTISWSLLKHCDSSSPEFSMIYSAYKLNKQGDNIEA